MGRHLGGGLFFFYRLKGIKMNQFIFVAFTTLVSSISLAQSAPDLVTSFENQARSAQLSCTNMNGGAARFVIPGNSYDRVAFMDAGSNSAQFVFVTDRVGVYMSVGNPPDPVLTIDNYFRGGALADVSAGLQDGDRQKTLQVMMNADGTGLTSFSVTQYTYTNGAWSSIPTFQYTCIVQ